MDREIAERLVAASKKLDSVVSDLDEISRSISDPLEGKKIRRAAGELLGVVFEGFLMDVVREFPDLDPDANKA